MDTKPLERFAQAARHQLHEQVASRLDAVLGTDSAELRGYATAIANLKHELRSTSRGAVVERVAYTWFNRFCALRFMDANAYTPMRIVSPADDGTLPEILQEAKAGVFDDELAQALDRKMVSDLLAGRMRSSDAQGEAYRLLLVSACNAYHASMPFMFEPIGDVTELLMPADLLSPNSVLAAAREALTPETCQDVEVIGWLYQFYIAEKKDEVDAKVKRGGKVEPDELPAKTALYTPHWIVRYLVENSLGRLWLLNRPHSRLADPQAGQMPYYIKPEEPETDFLRIGSPEEIRLGDPACGSGHMLTYSFDLLYLIYEEEGYNPPDIPRLILEKNLYGMEIDPRSASLAAFALTMKARSRDRRFLRRGVRPNICAYAPAEITEAELAGVAWFKALSTNLVDLPMRDALLHDLGLWAQIGNIGSLLQPQLTLDQIETLQGRIGSAGNLLDGLANERVLGVLEQLAYLARKYHVVITNPPYMGGGMNDDLKDFLRARYADVKSDLFSAFMIRVKEQVRAGGFIGMMTPFNWMFLSSFEKLRDTILDECTITSLVRPEFHAFFDSAFVSICGFTLFTRPQRDHRGAYIDLDRFYGADMQPEKALEAIKNPSCGWFYRASAADLKKIPGAPIAYWVSEKLIGVYSRAQLLGELVRACQGVATAENDRFLRHWHEVSIHRTGFGCTDRRQAVSTRRRWFPYNKGGKFRKWYGNQEYVIDWYDDGRELLDMRPKSVIRNPDTYFLEAASWSKVTSGGFSLRYFPPGFIYDVAGCSLFADSNRMLKLTLGVMNSPVMRGTIDALTPTLNFEVGQIARFPIVPEVQAAADDVVQNIAILIDGCRADWDAYETSWDFAALPLSRPYFRRDTLAGTYAALRAHWRDMTVDMQRLEEENNRIFIDAYGLQDELTPDVPLSEITLTCNPHYRFGGNKSEEELERLLRADTMREFISYAVGCMFGRYSLDKPGLILANAGETLDDYLAQVPHPTFVPDRDNVLPILDADWFTDDVVARFGRFLRVTFGEAYYAENLAFIEEALGRDIRSFFVREFYDDHLKRYKRRPIYWLFSSPGGSFNALVYMHRYRPDTVSVVLNDYLREYIAKLASARADALHNSIRAGVSNREKAAAVKEVARLDKVLKELEAYEEVLLDLARKQIRIDLDDGVKVNYAKFGTALRRVVGLNA